MNSYIRMLSIVMTLLLLNSSCTKLKEEAFRSSSSKPSKKYTSSTFKYQTSSIVEKDVTLTWNNRILANHVVEIFLGHPENGGKKVAKQLTSENGVLKIRLNVPLTENTIFLKYTFLGNQLIKEVVLQRSTFLDIMNKVINFAFPSAYAYDPCANSVAPWTGNYNFLATSYDTYGVPDNLIRGEEVLTSEFLNRVDISLPERKPVPQFHPEFLNDGAYSNLHVIEDAEVWITYISEGAGYKNTLGYYTYPTGSPPDTVSNISSFNIIYPNVSNSGSGGGLLPGDKVSLGTFQAGTTISYFLTANGWNNSTKCIRNYNNSWNYTVYSTPDLNPESTHENRKHNVLFYDEEESKIVIGFEDLKRDNGSDDDFNDAIFYLTSNPITAIDTQNIAPIDETSDSDNDGVDDEYDDYPDDPSMAFNNYYPSENTFGTLMFEDLWPTLGDYDFNDLIVNYNYIYITNATGEVVQIKVCYKIVATGAGQTNGFALKLPISQGLISSIEGQEIYTNDLSFNQNGTEKSQDYAVIIVTDNINQNIPKFSNVYSSRSVDPHVINITINFSTPTNIGFVGLPPYDPFLIKNQNRTDEIHQINFGPTSLGNSLFLGKHDDTSNINNGIYYRTVNYLPWVLNVPAELPHPKEKIPIFNAFNHFAVWASSEGAYYSDWYKNKSGYIQNNKVVPIE